MTKNALMIIVILTLPPNKVRDFVMIDEKERLINMFFNIRSNNHPEALKNCQSQCEVFLLKEDSEEIKDLINTIQALIIYFKTGNKKESRKWVHDLLDKLYSKSNLSLFNIRLLNSLLFVETNVEKVINNVNTCLKQLEVYRFHDHYVNIKISMNLNLLDSLMMSKYFDKHYDSKYDGFISKIIKEIITLNLDHKLNSKYYVGLAQIYKGILLKDQDIIYPGVLLLKSSDQENSQAIHDLLEVYKKKYNIVI